MHPYGVPREGNCKYPDCSDCTYYGKPSKWMKQKSKRKREMRRIWKKQELRQELQQFAD